MTSLENKYARRTSYDLDSKDDYEQVHTNLLSVESEAENSASVPPRIAANRRYLQQLHELSRRDPRFHPPSPPRLQRAALLVFIAFMFWLAIYIRQDILKVIFQTELNAERDRLQAEADTWYSDEFRFRPAASPVGTKTLANGNVRFNGATGL